MTQDEINAIEKRMWGVVCMNLNLTVPWYLMSSYAYYVQDDPIISDSSFDKLAKIMLENWNFIRHAHKYLITTGDLEAGSLLLREYPGRVIGAVEVIKSDVRKDGRIFNQRCPF